MQQLSRLSAALVALALATACADSPLAPTAAAATPPTTEPAGSTASLRAAATYAVSTCAGTSILLTADEKRSLDLHNTQRAANGLPAFCVDAKLTTAARAHSDEMIARSYFAHTSADGSAFSTRLSGFGYTPFSALAENIAWGSGTAGTPDQIFTGWMNSAGHRQNIQNGSLRQIGIGVSTGTYQSFSGARMYTVDFGTR